MTPDLYAIQYATSAKDVVASLGRCVAYVRNGPVLALLPEELEGLQACSAADVECWHARLEQSRRQSKLLSASARCWVEELSELFSMASHRLEAFQQLASTANASTFQDTDIQPVVEQ